MKMIKYLSLGLLTCLLIVAITLFFLPVNRAANQVNLIISAASSLSQVLPEIGKIYEASQPYVKIKYNFAASGILQQQIENGAPVDIFLPAALKPMDILAEKNLILPETRYNLLRNSLVLIVPENSRLINNFRDLNQEQIKKIALGEPRIVPAGDYGIQVLQKLGIFGLIKNKLIFTNNVRQVLTLVESGNVDAGLVYATDAKNAAKIRIVGSAPPGSHTPIIYPIAILKSSKNVDSAKQFILFLKSDRIHAIFAKYGFS